MRSSDFSVRLLLDEVEDLKRMERRILDALDWKMLSITAVFFTDFFVSLIVVHDNDPRKILPAVNPRRILNHVFFMHYNTEFTRFKPSIIAAVGVVAERSEKGSPGDSCVDPILRCKFVDMDEFENCFDLLRFKRATEIANAALIPRIDFPESPSPPAQQEEQEEYSEEEEAEEITNAAVIHGGGRKGRKRRRVVIGEKAEVLSNGRASVNPF
ncbi:putative cyclin-D6-1 [Rhododendron vialii]|uniref:putative cyclin-D6-1 n=1 Tax=Rhododendron vialii TaxID=182163 RepID=UPI00265F5F9A|nr:putative cyclin-D6-1 [Rhododendron vialii]